jgi:hypothetical protein
MGNYMRHIPPLSPHYTNTRNEECYPATGTLLLATISRVVWTCMVNSVEFRTRYAESLIIVIFNGYEVFTRYNNLWSMVTTWWGAYVMSWVELGILVLLFCGWLLYGFLVRGEWSLRIPSPQNPVAMTGIAAPLEDVQIEGSWVKKSFLWILNNV